MGARSATAAVAASGSGPGSRIARVYGGPDAATRSGYLAGVLIYAGIDEAGYGPMLGPLAAAATVFRIADADPDEGPPALWSRLGKVVARSPADRRRRLAIADSKRLKGARDGKAHPLRHLERGVLCMLAAADGAGIPDSDGDAFSRLGVDLARLETRPWYREATPLPLGASRDRLAIDAARVRRELDAAGVEVVGMLAEAVDEEAFNRLCRNAGKAHVNFHAAMRLVDRIWTAHGAAAPRVVIDRHGGRSDYVQPLMQAFPDAELEEVGRTDRISRYRLRRPDGEIVLSFEAESEDRHLPTALASMTAKLVREWSMTRFNRHFAAMAPEVKPTAGYVADARRWLEEIAPAFRSRGVRRSDLVRIA